MSEASEHNQAADSNTSLEVNSNAPLNISLYELFQDAFSQRLTPLRATKVTLVEISHALEELVIADRLPTMVFTGFQESSYWRKELDRYLEMAGIAHSVTIFAGGMPPEAPGTNYIHVKLSYQDTLRQEWFLLILTKQFSTLLCGRDRLEPVEDEAHRAFDTLWTFEPDLIRDLVTLLARVVQYYRPERYQQLMQGLEDFPPCQPEARYVTLLTSRVVNYLERQYQTQREYQTTRTLAGAAAGRVEDTALLPLFSQTYLLLLLGAISYHRLEDLATRLITDLQSFKAAYLLIDLSKAASIEPEAAARLVRLLRELHLCGITAALTGITPALASTFVAQNLDSSPGLTTYTNLEEASTSVLKKLGILKA